MNKALNDSTYRRGPRTHTHTQKKLDPVGLYSVELGQGTFPHRAVTPTPNHHGGTRTHDPKSTTHVPGSSATTTTRIHRKGPQTTTETKSPRLQTLSSRHDHCSSVTTTMVSHRKGPQTARTTTADQANLHNHCSTLLRWERFLYSPLAS